MNPASYLCRLSRRSQYNKICTRFQSFYGNQHNSHSNIANSNHFTPFLRLDQNRVLRLCLRSDNDNKDLFIDLYENMAGYKNYIAKISLPIDQAQQMMQRLTLLAKMNFKIEKNITEFSMDRFKETNLGNGIFQQLYTHRIPGLLYGEQKSVFYISVLKSHIDLAMQKSAFEEKNNNGAKNNGIMGSKNKSNNAPDILLPQPQLFISKHIFQQRDFHAWLPQPQLFISKHIFQQRDFHAWLPSIYSIQMPISRVSEFIYQMSKIFAHPNLCKWNENAVINTKEREHPNLRRMFSDENGWPLPSNHLIKNQ